MIDDQTPSPDNRRQHPRTTISFHAAVLSNGDRTECQLVDISPGGAQLSFDRERPPTSATEIKLDLGHLGQFPALVCWQREDSCGIQFMMDPRQIIDLVMSLARENAAR